MTSVFFLDGSDFIFTALAETITRPQGPNSHRQSPTLNRAMPLLVHSRILPLLKLAKKPQTVTHSGPALVGAHLDPTLVETGRTATDTRASGPRPCWCTFLSCRSMTVTHPGPAFVGTLEIWALLNGRARRVRSTESETTTRSGPRPCWYTFGSCPCGNGPKSH